MASPEFQERYRRDVDLVQRVQIGFTPEQPSEDNPRPRTTDGVMTEDGASALGELYLHYEPMIHKFARDTYFKLGRPPGFSMDDLDQEGFYGLFRAALGWNPERARGGFLSYASVTVSRQIMRRAEEVSTTVRLPHDVRDKVKKYRGIYWQSYEDTEHMPRRKRIARLMGVSVEAVDDFAVNEALTYQMGSINGGYFEDDRDQHSTFGKTRDDRWKPIDPAASERREVEEEILISEIQKIVNEALVSGSSTGLSDREAEILRLRFFGKDGKPMTHDEIAEEFGVSRERIRQIESKTLAKLRHPERAKKLRDLLQNA